MTPSQTIPRSAMLSARRTQVTLLGYALFVLSAGVIWWVSLHDPARLPFLAPWDFAPLMVLTASLSLWWYGRGLARMKPLCRPVMWRRVAFVAGILLTYFVVQTRFEYMAQHMFFINRAQHIVMHHLGPMLIVLGWPWETIQRGAPDWVARLLSSHRLARVLTILRQPVLGAVLFVGLIVLWLIPTVHFRAMIDPTLYAVMNWSMVLDGIVFWSMVLDPRPREDAGVSVFARALCTILIIPPQILLGALIVFSRRDLYEFYHWCGRIYPSIDPLTDQTLGGLIIWIPSAMASIMALLLVLNFARLNEPTSAAQADKG
ncbi:MAG: cytochrome c oxidase assembly protein [Rhodobacterales bacterium]